MIKQGAAIPAFIDKIADAALESGQRDREVVLARMRVDVPDAQTIDVADLAYYSNLVSKEQLEVDAQLVRTYLDFTKVRAGLMAVTGRLFGLRYETGGRRRRLGRGGHGIRRLPADGDEPIGRIYLDLHPREGKYKHAAQFDLVTGCDRSAAARGRAGLQLLPRADGARPRRHPLPRVRPPRAPRARRQPAVGAVLGRGDRVGLRRGAQPDARGMGLGRRVLQTFATNEAGEPIPADLVARMRRADDFGKGYIARTQMFYAAMSYWFHTERPADITERTRELQTRYSLFPYVEGTHMACAFGHLEGYSSGYYTYMWSLVIAKDLFSAFDRDNMFDAEVAGRYRDRVLRPGGSGTPPTSSPTSSVGPTPSTRMPPGWPSEARWLTSG
jgi:thimet oligopeptidase